MADTTPESATVAVTPPAGASLDKFVLTYCEVGTGAGAGAGECPTVDCPAASAGACAIAGLKANAAYRVTAVGVKGRARTLVSAGLDLTAKYP